MSRMSNAVANSYSEGFRDGVKAGEERAKIAHNEERNRLEKMNRHLVLALRAVRESREYSLAVQLKKLAGDNPVILDENNILEDE